MIPEPGTEIRFRNGEETLTLYVEKTYSDGVIGWCPQLMLHYFVHAANIVERNPA